MNKSLKILILVIVVASIGVITITSTTLFQPSVPPSGNVDVEPLITMFDGVEFEVSTDKSEYRTGEDVTITATLTNTNTTDTPLYCSGYTNRTTGQRHTLFCFYVYTGANTLIWEDDTYPQNADPPVYIGDAICEYNFTLNASEPHTVQLVWNQTYGKGSGKEGAPQEIYGDQVPPGTYHIFVELPLTLEYYYGRPMPHKNFGNTSTITIAENPS